MRKHLGDTNLYLHETIDIGGGTTQQFSDGFELMYLPSMQGLGARLFSIWESTPFNAHWPQVTIIWEIDSFAVYSAIGAAQAPGRSAATEHATWRDFLAGLGATGEGRLMYPGQFNRPLTQLQDEGFSANVVIHYWALEGGWDGFANHYPSWKGDPPAEITTWMTVAPSMRDGWEDSILQALPASPLG